MIKKRFISMLALLCLTVSGAWADADVTWNSSNVSDLKFWGGEPDPYGSYTKEGVTLRGNAENVDANWANYGYGDGINFNMNASGGYTFTAPDGKKFTKIEMTIYSYDGWYEAAYNDKLGSGWPSGEDAAMTIYYTNKVTWTGDATSTVDLLTDAGLSSFGGVTVSSIEFYFEAPATVAVTGVTLNQNEAQMTVGGETLTLTATVNPEGATDKSVTWSTSDGNVATVDNGVVTAVAAGTATITVTTTDGSFTATCAVTVAAPAPATYTVTLKSGTEDASNWQGKAGTGGYQSLPLEGVTEGQTVTLQYNGRLKVKGVKATSDAAPAKVPATVTTAPTATTGDIVAGSETALVSGGAATGGTMMYKVTTENTQPTSTEGFSADVPTAQTLAAGTYYVWYYVKADDSHTDSEISATGIEVTIAPDDRGKLICTDGHIHAYGEDAECTAARVAMIVYVGPTGHATYSHGLALALNDEGQMAWQAAINACSAKNTSTPVTGATWLLASKDQWNNMMGTNGAGGYAALRDGFSGISGASDLSVYNTYWSSTEGDSSNAWQFFFVDDGTYNGWWNSGKTYNCLVRACLAF